MTTFLLSSSISSTINRIPYTIKSHIVHPLNNSSLCLKTRSSSSSSSSCHTRTKTIKAVLSQQYSKIGAQTIGPIPSDQLLQSVEIAAKTGAQVVMEAVNKPRNISYKGLTDLVTDTDKMSEAAILSVVRKNFPDHLILGEEGGVIGDSSSDYLWCIDPLVISISPGPWF
ncbi:phosphatase IMPL1, chloroplastic [Tanacetum coccineum]